MLKIYLLTYWLFHFYNLGVGFSQFGALFANSEMYFFMASSLEMFPKFFHASHFALSTIFSLEGADACLL